MLSEYPLVRRPVSGRSLSLVDLSSSSDGSFREVRREEEAEGLRLRWEERASISSRAAKRGEMGRVGVCVRERSWFESLRRDSSGLKGGMMALSFGTSGCGSSPAPAAGTDGADGAMLSVGAGRGGASAASADGSGGAEGATLSVGAGSGGAAETLDGGAMALSDPG